MDKGFGIWQNDDGLIDENKCKRRGKGGVFLILAVCVDDNMGVLFNGRRQSQDRAVRHQILEELGSHTLWMNAYSAKQFVGVQGNIQSHESFLEKAEPGDWCFAETDLTAFRDEFLNRIEKIILFKWNRVYPADAYFAISLKDWTLEERTDFKGHSHDTITKEVYVK